MQKTPIKSATACNRPTIDEVMQKLQPHVGVKKHLPKTPNKGVAGFLLEKIAGIPTSPDCLDCVDGEVKSFPLKVLKKTGDFVPKETIAITMLNTDDLKNNNWSDSRCAKKMNRILYIPYLREGEFITIGNLLLIDSCDPNVSTQFKQIEDDYDAIRKLYTETEKLTSATGVYLQNRTKGPGNGSISRAFYLRPRGIMALLLNKSFFANASSSKTVKILKAPGASGNSKAPGASRTSKALGSSRTSKALGSSRTSKAPGASGTSKAFGTSGTIVSKTPGSSRTLKALGASGPTVSKTPRASRTSNPPWNI